MKNSTGELGISKAEDWKIRFNFETLESTLRKKALKLFQAWKILRTLYGKFYKKIQQYKFPKLKAGKFFLFFENRIRKYHD